MQEVKNMPVGIQSFEIIRLGLYLYINKTHFIPSLEKLGLAYFLTRLYRFGKNLFVLMLQSCFEGLKAFYSVIKSLNSYIHISFLNEITKLSKVSIFSDLNNPFDISFDREYSSICGITKEELKNNFSKEIKVLAKEEDKTYDEMLINYARQIYMVIGLVKMKK